MAIKDINWRNNHDIHYVRNLSAQKADNQWVSLSGEYRVLNSWLQIKEKTGDPIYAKDAIPGRNPSDLVDIKFVPQFKHHKIGDLYTSLDWAGQGVGFDEKTGKLYLAAAASVPPLHNFIVTAVIRHNVTEKTTVNCRDVTQQKVVEKKRKIRLHIHEDIKKIWLTPYQTTIPNGVNYNRLTVLARFDDGLMADITDWPCLKWESSDLNSVEIKENGGIITKGAKKKVTIRVKLDLKKKGSTTVSTLSGSATVSVIGSFPDQKIKMEPVPGQRNFAEGNKRIVNILFLPDGWTKEEALSFKAYVAHLRSMMQTSSFTFPYNLLKDSFNFWYAFVPSPQPGLSDSSEYYLKVRR